MSDINSLDIIKNLIVCPFRTEVRVGQRLNEEGEPEQYQITLFPECQYTMCPYYNSKGKTNNEKCFRAV